MTLNFTFKPEISILTHAFNFLSQHFKLKTKPSFRLKILIWNEIHRLAFKYDFISLIYIVTQNFNLTPNLSY